LTTPTFDEVVVKLDPKYWGKDKLVIKKEGKGDYIKEIKLDGKKYNKYLISHKDLINAGEITFVTMDR
jgi:putative alpha-1,2-mannosidase